MKEVIVDAGTETDIIDSSSTFLRPGLRLVADFLGLSVEFTFPVMIVAVQALFFPFYVIT